MILLNQLNIWTIKNTIPDLHIRYSKEYIKELKKEIDKESEVFEVNYYKTNGGLNAHLRKKNLCME